MYIARAGSRSRCHRSLAAAAAAVSRGRNEIIEWMVLGRACGPRARTSPSSTWPQRSHAVSGCCSPSLLARSVYRKTWGITKNVMLTKIKSIQEWVSIVTWHERNLNGVWHFRNRNVVHILYFIHFYYMLSSYHAAFMKYYSRFIKSVEVSCIL